VRSTLTVAALLAAALASSPSHGDGLELAVEVGAKVRRPVDNAIGWFCDDPTLIRADIVTIGDDNYWVVEGAKPGSTQCRVGTDPSRASFVFDVTVKRASAKRRR
jgi:hypothetical protein